MPETDRSHHRSFLLLLRYSKRNDAKPNNPIIETIMSPNSEFSMLLSVWKVSGESRGSAGGRGAEIRRVYALARKFTRSIRQAGSCS